jgi:hypothetical protein
MGWRDLLGLEPRMQDLAGALISTARRHNPAATWTYDAENACIRGDSGLVINLANMFREYAASPRSARKSLLQKYASLLEQHDREIPGLWTLAAKAIYPVVRSQFDNMVIDINARIEKEAPRAWVRWPLAGDVHIRLVYDHGRALARVGQELLDTWGQTESAVFQQALANLRALAHPQWTSLDEHVYQLRSEVSYEESFLLLDSVIAKVPFEGTIVLVPSNRGVLLAARGDTEASVLALLDHVHRCHRECPWPMSTIPLHKVSGVWQPFALTGLAARRAHALQQIDLSGVYADQREALQKLVGDDTYVAKVDFMGNGDGLEHIESWCVWSEDITSLLPRTDVVIVSRGDTKDAFIVAWDELATIAGRHLKTTVEDPPRFLVDSFADATEYAQLEKVGRPLRRNG